MYIKKIKKNYPNTGRSYFVFQLFEDVENEKKGNPKMILTLGNRLNIAESEHQDLADCIESKARNKTTLKTFSKEVEALAEVFTEQLKKRENARNKKPHQSNKKTFHPRAASSKEASSENRERKSFSKFNSRIKASFNKPESSSKDSVKKEHSLSRFKSKRSFLKPNHDLNASVYDRDQTNQDSFERTSSAFKPKKSFSKSNRRFNSSTDEGNGNKQDFFEKTSSAFKPKKSFSKSNHRFNSSTDESNGNKQDFFERTSSAFKPKKSFSPSKKRAPSKTNRPWELAIKKQGK